MLKTAQNVKKARHFGKQLQDFHIGPGQNQLIESRELGGECADQFAMGWLKVRQRLASLRGSESVCPLGGWLLYPEKK
jgi:hypothetical protein